MWIGLKIWWVLSRSVSFFCTIFCILGSGPGEEANDSFRTKSYTFPWWVSHDDDSSCLQRGGFEFCRSVPAFLICIYWKSLFIYIFFTLKIRFLMRRGAWLILDACLWCWCNEQNTQRKVCWALRKANLRKRKKNQITNIYVLLCSLLL